MSKIELSERILSNVSAWGLNVRIDLKQLGSKINASPDSLRRFFKKKEAKCFKVNIGNRGQPTEIFRYSNPGMPQPCGGCNFTADCRMYNLAVQSGKIKP